jgi:RND family efflux transporter MFP subunit
MMSHPFLARALAAVLMCLIAGCKKGDASADSVLQSGTAAVDSSASGPQLALPVTVEEARNGDLVVSIITNGVVRSEAESKLRFEVAGVVSRVMVRPGQSVRKGDIMATLDSTPFVNALRRAQLDVQQAQLRYDDMIGDSTLSGRVTAERRRNVLTRSGLEVAHLTLDQARIDRQRAYMRAPFDGVIDRVEATEGERSDQGDATITIVDIQRLRIEAAVLEHDIPLIREGGEAIVNSSAAPNQLTRGKITNVLPIIDSVSHSGRAYVVLSGNGVLRPGMTVDVRLEAHRLRGRRIVPSRAVVERDGRPLVFVVRGDRAQWVYIQPGRSNGFETEVLPDTITNEIPVKAGELVIVQGQTTLTHDAPVKVMRKEELIKR